MPYGHCVDLPSGAPYSYLANNKTDTALDASSLNIQKKFWHSQCSMDIIPYCRFWPGQSWSMHL
jgi:hypothetical protein